MALDDEAARELRRSARRASMLGAFGAVAVFGFIAGAFIDPDRLAPAINADQSPAGSAIAMIGLTAAVVLTLVAMIGLVRVRHQRRTLTRSEFRTVPARWAPTLVRGHHTPGLVVEQPDGSWRALALEATLRPRPLEKSVRSHGAVEVAQVAGYVVVRGSGSTALLSAKAKGIVTEPPPAESSTPLFTLQAGAPNAPGRPIDDGVWFRDATRTSAGEVVRHLLVSGLLISSFVRSAIRGDVLYSAFWLVGAFAPPAAVLLTRIVTTVDHEGIAQKHIGRRPKLLAFDRISTIERHATLSPTVPTRVVVTADDDTTVVVRTRRPDDLVAALRRGRDLA